MGEVFGVSDSETLYRDAGGGQGELRAPAVDLRSRDLSQGADQGAADALGLSEGEVRAAADDEDCGRQDACRAPPASFEFERGLEALLGQPAQEQPGQGTDPGLGRPSTERLGALLEGGEARADPAYELCEEDAGQDAEEDAERCATRDTVRLPVCPGEERGLRDARHEASERTTQERRSHAVNDPVRCEREDGGYPHDRREERHARVQEQERGAAERDERRSGVIPRREPHDSAQEAGEHELFARGAAEEQTEDAVTGHGGSPPIMLDDRPRAT